MDLISVEAAIKAMSCLTDSTCEGEAIEALQELPAAVSDFITCADCRYAGEQIADGRYWCSYHEDYMRYCSDAERRQ